MKMFFIMLYMDTATETKGGGFTEAERAELKGAIKDLEEPLRKGVKADVEEMLKKHKDTINESITKFGDVLTKKEEADTENQKALDKLLTDFKAMQDARSTAAGERIQAKSLQAAMYEALGEKENQEGIASVGKGQRYKMKLKGAIDLSAPTKDYYDPSVIHKMDEALFDTKAVGNMTAANNLTGQGVVDYGGRQVILPAQKVNARDLIPTVRSETGTYVYFRESAGEGSISRQSGQGSAKTQIDFDFARVEVASEYIAGYSRFAKQLMRQLPFLQNTLPRLLQREFFKVENRRFYDIVATAWGVGGTQANSTETIDLLEIMDAVTALWDADYEASFGVLRYTALNRINKWLVQNGSYAGAGGIQSGPNGSIMVNGTPVYPVTWVPSYDKFLTFDRNYVERIEVESLSVEFFMEDGNNVTTNQVTARIECMEEFNAMQPAAIVLEDLGNSASS